MRVVIKKQEIISKAEYNRLKSFYESHKIDLEERDRGPLHMTGREEAIGHLENVEKGRPISQSRVELFKRLILNYDYSCTNSTVSYDIAGHVKDGVSWLIAIAEVGVPIPIKIDRNLRHNEVLALDKSRKRTISHDLLLELGDNVPVGMGPVARMALSGHRQLTLATPPQKRRFAIAHMAVLSEYLKLSKRDNIKSLYNSGWVGALAIAAIVRDKPAVDAFYQRFANMDFNHKNDPAKKMRMQIEKLKVHGTRPVGAAAESRDNQVHYGLAICAINMELAGNLSGAKLFVPKHDFHGSNSYRKNWLKKDKKSRSDYADTIIRPKITARI